jgi:hypothetical protein
MRNTGLHHAETEPVADMGGGGVIPLPPLSLFFGRGSPPTHMPGQVGGTPPHHTYNGNHVSGPDPWIAEVMSG